MSGHQREPDSITNIPPNQHVQLENPSLVTTDYKSMNVVSLFTCSPFSSQFQFELVTATNSTILELTSQA